MGFYRKHKIIIALFFLILGILTARFFQLTKLHLFIVLSLSLTGIFINRNLVILAFFPVALLLSFNSWEKPYIPHHLIGENVTLCGTLTKNPDKRQNSWKYTVRAEKIKNGSHEYSSDLKIAVYSKYPVENAYRGSRVTIHNAELEKIKGFKNPGSFNLRDHFSKKGIYYTSFIDNPLYIQPDGRDKNSNYPLFILSKFRKEYENFVRKTVTPPNSEMINAVTVGVKGAVPEETKNSFSRLGISHLLAISGLHTGALAVFIYFIAKSLLKRSKYMLLMHEVPKIASAFTVVPLIIYTGLAGFANPVLRAFTMITLYIAAFLFNREEEKLNILAAAAVIILLLEPKSLFELSFQLSFLAVSGIVLFHRAYPFRFNTYLDKLYSMIKTTVAASLFTLPLVINNFGYFPVATIPANLIAVPLVELLVVPLGLLSIIVFPVSKTVCAYMLEANSKLMELLVYIAEYILSFDFSYITVPNIGPAGYVFFLLTTVFILTNRYSGKLKYFAIVSFLLFSVTVVTGFDLSSSNRRLVLNFLDTGNKSYILVRTPDEKSILISGGYSYYSKSDFEEKAAVVPFLLRNMVTELDYLLLLSTDRSHLKGAVAIAKRINIRNIWTNGSRLNSGLWEVIREQGIRWKNTRSETKPLFLGNAELRFIKPYVKESLWNSRQSRPMLLVLKNGNHKFLIGEGIHRPEAQKELYYIYKNRIDADVVFVEKIDNTGKNFKDFLKAVGPKYVVTTRGGKRRKDFYNLYVTNDDGMVKIVSEGKRLTADSYN